MRKGQIAAKQIKYTAMIVLVILIMLVLIAYGNNISKGILEVQHYNSRNTAYLLTLVSSFPSFINYNYDLDENVEISVSDRVLSKDISTKESVASEYYYASPKEVQIIPLNKHRGSFSILNANKVDFNKKFPSDCSVAKEKEVHFPSINIKFSEDSVVEENSKKEFLERLRELFPSKTFLSGDVDEEVFSITFTNTNNVRYMFPTILSKKFACLLSEDIISDNYGEISHNSVGDVALNWDAREDLIRALDEI